MINLRNVEAKDKDLLFCINQKYLYEMTAEMCQKEPSPLAEMCQKEPSPLARGGKNDQFTEG